MTYQPLNDSFGFLLGQTYRKVSHLTNTAFKSFDVTAEQWILLICLLEKNGITQTQLGELAGKDKTTVTRLLDILERKRMVVKREHESDRRAFLIYLTDAGERIATQLIKVEEQVMNTVLRGLDEDVITSLKNGLRTAQQQAEQAVQNRVFEPEE